MEVDPVRGLFLKGYPAASQTRLGESCYGTFGEAPFICRVTRRLRPLLAVVIYRLNQLDILDFVVDGHLLEMNGSVYGQLDAVLAAKPCAFRLVQSTVNAGVDRQVTPSTDCHSSEGAS